MYALQLILENGIEFKVFGDLKDLKSIKSMIERKPNSKKFMKLTDGLTVRPVNICAIEIFDVSEGVTQDEN